MELASMLAGEEFGDNPRCVSPLLVALLRSYNDLVDSGRRQDLYAYASSSVGTRSSRRLERRRRSLCRRWLRARGAARTLADRHPLSTELLGCRVAWCAAARGRRGHAEVLALIDELISLGGNMTAGPLDPSDVLEGIPELAHEGSRQIALT
jgi:hypothetical protein